MERTLSIIKPDGVKRGLIGEVVRMLEQNNLDIVAMKMLHMTKKQAEGFYAVHRERPFFESLTDFMSSGPAISNEVLEVPQCKIMRGELQSAFTQLYEGDWTQDHPGHGHCELYFKSGEVSLSWDASYAHGGFSQVYEEMNQALQDRVQTQLEDLEVRRLLDIFSGSGNLSNAFVQSGGDRLMIDNYSNANGGDKPENFYQMDLYDEQTLPNFIRRAGTSDFDALLIDPPRRGFPGLDNWVKKIKPRYVFYVSCNPASLARDLRGLTTRFRIKSVQLLDLFPATAHFETFVVLQMR